MTKDEQGGSGRVPVRVKLSVVELLELAVRHRDEMERRVWLSVRLALDVGVPPTEVATSVGTSVPTMYRCLKREGLSHGPGRPPAQ